MLETIIMIILGLIGLAILFSLGFFGWVVGIYNYLQSGKQNIKTQWSNIKTEYQRRYNLFLNLAETVKSYKKHENKTLKEVIEARSKLNFKGSKTQQMKNMDWLDSFFSKLSVVFEKYPQLKANEQHNQFMEEMRITEDRINVARTDYNDIVREYNTLVVTFPSSLIANFFKMKEEEFYENELITDKAPKVSLD